MCVRVFPPPPPRLPTHPRLCCRRMHRNVLETLFNPNQQQPSSNSSDSTDDTSSTDQQQQQQDPTAAAIAAVAAVRMSPARLFAAVYDGNLLLNGSFLERLNTHKGQRGARVWVSVFGGGGLKFQ